jgi:hypothetical protein
MVVCQVGLWVVLVRGQVGAERGREKESGKKSFFKNSFSFLCCTSRGRRRRTMSFKTD